MAQTMRRKDLFAFSKSSQKVPAEVKGKGGRMPVFWNLTEKKLLQKGISIRWIFQYLQYQEATGSSVA